MTPKQKKIAAKAEPRNKIDGKDFAVLRAEKAKGRGKGLQDEKMKPGKIMKAALGTIALGKAMKSVGGKDNKKMPAALFVSSDTSSNIRNLDAIFTDKGKQITNAIFGNGAKNAAELGNGVYKQYGVAEKGFDISSIQFAIHYMFENIS